MPNIFLELDRLKFLLENKGIDPNTVQMILQKARADIQAAMAEQGEAAMQLAIEEGVEKRSPEFINELRLNSIRQQAKSIRRYMHPLGAHWLEGKRRM